MPKSETSSEGRVKYKAVYGQSFPEINKNYKFASLTHRILLEDTDYGKFSFYTKPPMDKAKRDVLFGRLSIKIPYAKNFSLSLGEDESLDGVTVVGSYAGLEYGPVSRYRDYSSILKWFKLSAN